MDQIIYIVISYHKRPTPQLQLYFTLVYKILKLISWSTVSVSIGQFYLTENLIT